MGGEGEERERKREREKERREREQLNNPLTLCYSKPFKRGTSAVVDEICQRSSYRDVSITGSMKQSNLKHKTIIILLFLRRTI